MTISRSEIVDSALQAGVERAHWACDARRFGAVSDVHAVCADCIPQRPGADTELAV